MTRSLILLLWCAFFSCAVHAGSIIQLGLNVDASSSTDEELPTFLQGVANAIATLKTDGSLERTLTQFSAKELVIFGPEIKNSPTPLRDAVSAALAISCDRKRRHLPGSHYPRGIPAENNSYTASDLQDKVRYLWIARMEN